MDLVVVMLGYVLAVSVALSLHMAIGAAVLRLATSGQVELDGVEPVDACIVLALWPLVLIGCATGVLRLDHEESDGKR